MRSDDLQMTANGTKLQVIDGRINFVCLREKCPESCCGPFGGAQKGIDSVDGRSFSEIVLTHEDSRRILNAGLANLVERGGDGRFRMKLLGDGTCTALEGGKCSIQEVKPTVCRAFPFYVDMFVGLCGVTACSGFGQGWTRIESLSGEVNAARQMYEFWLSELSPIGQDRLAGSERGS